MDLTFYNRSSDEQQIINGEDIHAISVFDDVVRDEEIFKILLTYNEQNWLKVRSATHFHDVEVPECPVKIRAISIQQESLLITGYVSKEELVEWTKS